MRKRILSAIVSIAMLASLCGAFAIPAGAATANVPRYQETARVMEKLNRGLVAVKTTANSANGVKGGVYLSWRLLGTESLTNQAFDIYRDGSKIYTTGPHDATCYTDEQGTASSKYIVVKAGESIAGEEPVTPINQNFTARDSLVGGTSEKNSFTYIDIPISRPADVARMGDGKTSYYYTTDDNKNGGANDASIADLDGDGDYEIILKWEPNDMKDSAGADYTGRVYLDGYEIDPNNSGYMWRIDLGQNVTAGQHYTQFIAYDFDGDGKAEIACKTAPGSYSMTSEGKKIYVTEVGDSEEIRNADNDASLVGTSGGSKGKNLGAEYLTVFDGETGAPLVTTDFIPLGQSSDWGDGKYNRAERFLAGVAYLDGVHPSIIMCRGYYAKAVIRAYNFDDEDNITMLWEHNGTSWTEDSMYRSGNHSLSIADVDNDGKDEIVYGSAVCDDNGKGMANTKLGHGDALHVNDFNNDGIQEAFSVKEHKEGIASNAANFRVPSTGKTIWGKGASADTGRGVMGNIDDAYAAEHPNALALAWSSSHTNVFDLKGNEINARPATSSRGMTNFLIYWDGDLGRELLDDNQFAKYHADTGYTIRFYDDKNGYFPGTTNNDTKHVPSLSADLWGDWREEVIMPTGKGKNEKPALRIFTSTLPTEYRLTTLMHDSQYRCAIAWQNVGYNQPPHTSYYIGSAALATDENGNTLNYLAPAWPFTTVAYPAEITPVAVTGVKINGTSMRLEKGKTESVSASVIPDNATKKGLIWTSSDETVATVTNGVVKGIKDGTATITATSREDSKYSDSINVEVYTVPVSSVKLSDENVELGVGLTKELKVSISPENASDQAVTWKSDDESIATVSKDGVVTGVNYGSTTITATSTDLVHKATANVQVKPMEVIDKTGENTFVSSTNTTDFNSGVANASLTLVDSENDISEYHRDFEVFNENKATLSFGFITGGQKKNTTDTVWDWDGREYELRVRFLDDAGDNILTLVQPYGASPDGKHTGAGLMTSKTGTDDEKNFESDWVTVEDKIGNVQGSAKTWLMSVEFDYENDTATAVIEAADSSTWQHTDGKYSKVFDLNGANFKTYEVDIVKTGEGALKANPQVYNVEYTLTKTADGDAELLYERGTELKPWSSADLTDWVQTNSASYQLSYDSGSGKFGYSPANPTAPFGASRKINGIEKNALVTYDVDWYFGRATGRLANIEYLQLGSALRIGYTAGYLTFVSTDGGATYDGISKDTDNKDVSDSSKSIFTGSNTDIMKNVKVVFNAAENKIESFQFGGKDIDVSGYTLPDGTTFDTVSFGFTRGGKVGDSDDYVIPVGLNKIRVSQFIPETEPAAAKDIAGLVIRNVADKTATVTYMLTDNTAKGSAMIIGALYDGDKLVEVKKRRVTEVSTGESDAYELTFDHNIADYDLKVMMWNDMKNIAPLAPFITRAKAN